MQPRARPARNPSIDDLEHGVHRTVTTAHLQRPLDRPRDELLRLVHRRQGIAAPGKTRRDGRGEDAAAPVGVRRRDTWRLEFDELSAVEIVVDCLLLIAVAALDDRGARLLRDDAVDALRRRLLPM